VSCHSIIEKIFESAGERPLSPLSHVQIAVHLLFCPQCAREVKKLEILQDIMKNDFFPPSPDFTELVMDQLALTYQEDMDREFIDAPTGISFRGWVITGFIILISLSTSFFGIDFIKVANTQGSSFLLPIGLTIGIVLTGYGALFIGSHLKELSNRFGLH
jgi:hypothetical protein